MKTVVVLAMHGAPPNDFPKRETDEMFGLHAHLEAAHAARPEGDALERRFAELDARMRAWPLDDTKLDLSKVTMIDFAFSNKKGGTPGSGRVTMDEIRATY